jgi:hypothetical protein
MRWEWEGGAVLFEGPTAEGDVERAEEDDRDDEDAVSRGYAPALAAESAASSARSLARAACSFA